MYGESQFPYVTQAKMSVFRDAMKQSIPAMPHVPDDIYLHIMSFIMKDYIAARDEPPTNENSEIAMWRKDGQYDRGYDLPAFVQKGVGAHWFIKGKLQRLYGLPAVVYYDDKLSWYRKDREVIYRKRKRTMTTYVYGARTFANEENVDEPKLEIVF